MGGESRVGTDLVVDDDVVLGSHVVCNVVVDNESEQSVEQSKIYLLIELLKMALHHHITLPLSYLPYLLKIVDTYTHTQSHSHSGTLITVHRPWHHLYTSRGGGSVSAGLIHGGNSRRLSASYHRYWSR